MGESNFEETTREQPSSDSGKSAINVMNVNDYLFIEHAYKGTDGFKNGKYLIPHQREMYYDSRRQFSDYVNFLHPIVRAMLDPVFSDVINRVYSGALVDSFVNDCNGNGMHIQTFVSLVTQYVRLHGVCFVVLDNVSDQPESMTDAIKAGKKPYSYIRKAYQVEDYTLNMFGGLQDIMFIDICITVDGKETQLYRRWTKNDTQLFRKSDDSQDAKYVPYSGPVSHDLGRLPVLSFYETDRDNPDILLPHPKMYGIAKLNHSIYNQDSERRELERNQGFSILCVQEDGTDPAGKVLGSNNYLSVPIDASNMPVFAAPPAELLEGLLLQREKKRDDLFSLAEQNGVIGVKKEAKSGIALSYEFRAYETTLRKTAEIATRVEAGVFELFSAWTEIRSSYTFEYPMEFQPQRELEQVTIYETVLNYPGLPSGISKRIMINTYKMLFPDAETDEVEAIEREIDEADIEFNRDPVGNGAVGGGVGDE